MRTLVLAAVLSALVPAPALACEASPSGTRSYDTRVSPRAGYLCLYTVTLYSGATCSVASELGHLDVGCNVAERMAVTDDGRFVSILAPRTSHRGWSIVRVLGIDGRAAEVTLDDLAATTSLRGVVRLAIERDAIVFRDRSAEVRVPILEIAARLTPS